MKSPDSADVERSLAELSDEDAEAIMEGRLPAEDSSQVAIAARSFVRGVVSDSAQQPSTGSAGARAVGLAVRQPWMRMAAAVVLGVVVGLLVSTPEQPADSPVSAGVASANVTYLETTRSANADSIPRIEIRPDEPWITLIAYPDIEAPHPLTVQIDRSLNQDGRPPVDPRSGTWARVWRATAGSGSQDSVAVTIDARLLMPGYHRLIIEAEQGNGQPEYSYLFRVVE